VCDTCDECDNAVSLYVSLSNHLSTKLVSYTDKMAHVAVSFTDLCATIETMGKQLMTATIHQ